MRRLILTLCLCCGIGLTTAASASAQSLSPVGYTFPTTQVGSKSAPKAFTLTAGVLPLASNVTTSTAAFVQTNNCLPALPPTTSCTINVVFAPTKAAPQQEAFLLAGGQMASLSGSTVGNLLPVKKCKKKKKGKKGAVAAKKKKRKCHKKGKKK